MFRSKTTRDIFPTGDSPAPTAYQRESRATREPSRTAFGHGSPRFERTRDAETPGPGQYDGKPVRWGKPPAEARLARATERDSAQNGVPGPGKYEVAEAKREVGPTSAFASASARGQRESTTPGPGAYNVTRKAKKKGQAIHAGRFDRWENFMESPTRPNPAPDAYQRIPEVSGQGKSIPRTPRFEKKAADARPGPGAYDVTHGTFLIRSHNVDFLHKF
jgi:hypothetical protein